MVRQTCIIVMGASLLAGCGSGDNGPRNLRARLVTSSSDAPAQPGGGVGQQFSYSHNWSFLLSHAVLPRHFEAARDACLTDKTLDCRLLSANLETVDDTAEAALSVQLPHASLDRFEHLLRDPHAGESADDVRMTSRATHARSVETAAADSDRKVVQLVAYRDRLAAIAKRPNLSIDDLIKLEAEQARVESDLDAAMTEQHGIAGGLAREEVDVTLLEKTPPAPGPLAAAWDDAGHRFADNIAGVLSFAIGALPWLPLIAGGVWLLVRLVRLAWRRKPLANTAAA